MHSRWERGIPDGNRVRFPLGTALRALNSVVLALLSLGVGETRELGHPVFDHRERSGVGPEFCNACGQPREGDIWHAHASRYILLGPEALWPEPIRSSRQVHGSVVGVSAANDA